MIAVIGALVIALGLLSAPLSRADTLYVGGTNVVPEAPGPTNVGWVNGGRFGTAATAVGYPASIVNMDSSVSRGADRLDAALRTPGPHVVIGASQGAVVLNEEKRRLASEPGAPRDIQFVQVADPTNPRGLMGRFPGVHIPIINLTFTSAVRSQYTTTVISRQYDGVADWPAQPSVLAGLNALMGIVYLHPHYGGVSLDGIQPTVDGNTTYYLVPTANLPLLQPLRDLGVDTRVVDAIQMRLKPLVDRGYVERSVIARPQVVTGLGLKTRPHRRSCTQLQVCAG